MRTDLKVLRIKSQLTQQEAADRLGVSVATYNLVENGKREGSKTFWQNVQTVYELDDGTVWQLMQNK